MWWLVAIAGWLGCSAPPADPPPAAADVVATSPDEIAPPLPLPAAPPGKYAADHVLVAWRGAAGATATRSRAEAEQLAQALYQRAQAGEPFSALRQALGPADAAGQPLGVYWAGTYLPTVEAAIASVAPGELAPLVTSPYGVHLLRREAILELEASHLVVGYAGAPHARTSRTRAEAEQRVAEAAARVAAGEPFATVAAAYSDDADTRAAGGHLGRVGRGQLVPAVEEALFQLAPGQTSEPVASPWGLHLMHRAP